MNKPITLTVEQWKLIGLCLCPNCLSNSVWADQPVQVNTKEVIELDVKRIDCDDCITSSDSPYFVPKFEDFTPREAWRMYDRIYWAAKNNDIESIQEKVRFQSSSNEYTVRLTHDWVGIPYWRKGVDVTCLAELYTLGLDLINEQMQSHV